MTRCLCGNIVVFVLLLTVDFGVTQDLCRTPNGDVGTCILLETCLPLKEISRKHKKTPTDLQFLRQSDCGLHLNVKPKVCCPPKGEWSDFTTAKPLNFPTGNGILESITLAPAIRPNRPLFTSTGHKEYPENYHLCPHTVQAPDKDSLCCGKESTTAFRIFGGSVTAIGQYPWLALIQYDTGVTGCGGALISSRYVLTAGHCLGKSNQGMANNVRLAEYNTSSYPVDVVETDGGGEDRITVLVVPIEREIIHPGYKKVAGPKVNDIGLIKLARNVPYTEYIRPICMPYEDITISPPDDLYFSVAGWGSTEHSVYSDVKQEVDVPYVSLAKCQKTQITKRQNVMLEKTQICAGGEKGKDSCRGDSGGPLMHLLGDTYVIIGIVSFGHHECGKEGVPAVYTHVYMYLDWLQKEMV